MVVGQKCSVFACLLFCILSLPCQAQSDAAKEWTRKIVDQLQVHKHYPLEACGKSGETKVAFTLDRAGKLISTSIVTGTGVPALDKAALEMVRSAQPFPPAPPEVADGDLRLVAPVIFVMGATTSSCDAVRRELKLPAVMRSICRGC